MQQEFINSENVRLITTVRKFDRQTIGEIQILRSFFRKCRYDNECNFGVTRRNYNEISQITRIFTREKFVALA